jgi:drug/metabolite transporter (DMT)-like permease
MPHTGPALGSILSSSELPVSMLMAFFILHESVAPLQWAGMALILIGIVLPNTQAVKEALCRK